jgi:hypothetical protein
MNRSNMQQSHYSHQDIYFRTIHNSWDRNSYPRTPRCNQKEAPGSCKSHRGTPHSHNLNSLSILSHWRRICRYLPHNLCRFPRHSLLHLSRWQECRFLQRHRKHRSNNQSPTMHAFPSAQSRQSPPPQSTSVSWPFTMLSEQVGAQVSTTTSVATSPVQSLLPETVR